MKILRCVTLIPFAVLTMVACASEDSPTKADTETTASDESTDSSSGKSTDSEQGTDWEQGTDSNTQDKDTASNSQSETEGSHPLDSDSTAKDTDPNPGTATQPEPDTDPLDLCDVPSDFLSAPSTSSYFVFNASGRLNSTLSSKPLAADAFIEARYKGKTLDFSGGNTVAYYSSAGQRAFFRMSSAPDQDGHFYYAEAKITIYDLASLNYSGEPLFDLYDGETQTTTRLYEGWQDAGGNIEKLCLLGVPGDRAFYYACTTDITYIRNVGEPFSMAGNIEIFDDTDYLSQTEYAMCLCDNGAGSWRSCDPGIPNDYGRLRLSFRDGSTEADYFSKYVYDESKLWKDGNLDTTYVSANPKGMWRHTYSFMTGGLNILSSSSDIGDFIYGFGVPIPYGSGVIGMVSHDLASGQIIVRQHSFSTLNEGADPVGLWLIAYVPDDVLPGEIVEFGTGNGTAKLIAYDSQDKDQCIQAIACGGYARVQRATNLAAAQGGTFELRSEADENGSRMSLPLVYPGEAPACNMDTYLKEAGLPSDLAICDKL
jgi:hypothetical protein